MNHSEQQNKNAQNEMQGTFMIVKPGVLKSTILTILQELKNIDGMSYTFFILQCDNLSSIKSFFEKLYEEHKDKSFYNELIAYMCTYDDLKITCIMCDYNGSGNVFDIIRTQIGETNPADAADFTWRKRFGESVQANVIHSPRSKEDFDKEVAIIGSMFQYPFDRKILSLEDLEIGFNRNSLYEIPKS